MILKNYGMTCLIRLIEILALITPSIGFSNDLTELLTDQNCLFGGFERAATDNVNDETGIDTALSAPHPNESMIVAGCVNAITGDYVESSQDLVIQGPEPIIFQRSYSSSDCRSFSLFSGWRHNHDSSIRLYQASYNSAIYEERSGRTARYNKPFYFSVSSSSFDANQSRYTFDSLNSPGGLINTGLGVISAHTNVKNNVLSFKDKFKMANVLTGSGSKIQFKRIRVKQRVHFLKQTHECKPNGNHLYYHHDSQGNLKSISSKDPTKKFTFGSIKVKGVSEQHFKEDSKCVIEASDGRKVVYQLEKHRKSGRKGHQKKLASYHIKEVQRSDAPTEQYQYTSRTSSHQDDEQISCKKLPHGRFRSIKYYKKDDWVDGDHRRLRKYEARIDRVSRIFAPVSSDSRPVCTHRFDYKIHSEYEVGIGKYQETRIQNHFGNGVTTVFDAHNHRTEYAYDCGHRPTSITRYTGNTTHNNIHSLEIAANEQIRQLNINPLDKEVKKYDRYSSEAFYWEDEDLQAHLFRDKKDQVCRSRILDYDFKGNITSDTFYGNITGNSAPIDWDVKKQKPKGEGVDQYNKRFEYSDDQWNLLLCETEDNGKTTHYTYHPKTHLLISKLIGDGKTVQQRYFYEYNTLNVCVKTICDNGSVKTAGDLTGVTERRITYITPTCKAPFGLPEVVEECFLDLKSGVIKRLKHVINEYSKEGRLLSQQHYDALNTLRYTLTWSYDPHGNVIKETNALGEVIEREFDENNNLTFERGPHPNFCKINQYDFSNRLIRSEEIHSDGVSLITTHRYDFLNNRIETIDCFGNKTRFKYDEFGRLIETHYPPMVTESKSLIYPVERKTYDIFNNVTSITNGCGATIEKTYNALNQPILVKYPDGTSESFEYNLDGSLCRSIAKNKSVTSYQYNCLGQLLKTEMHDASGNLLDRSVCTYNGFHKISTIDADGHETFINYDGAGREIEIRKGDSLITYEYNALGYPHKTSTWLTSKTCSVNMKKYDLLGRVIRESIEDEHGTILETVSYAYDCDGNRIQETRKSQAEESTVYTEYNTRKQPVRMIDAEGNSTQLSYNYAFRNAQKQCVLQTITTDPLGNQIVLTANTHNLEGCTEKYNALGDLLAKRECFYNRTGNCESVVETVITPNKPRRSVKTHWQYNLMGEPTAITEAVGEPEQKHVRFLYGAYGEKKTFIRPDGVKLHYSYDGKGRLSKFSASDCSFIYQYTYGYHDLPVCIANLLTKKDNKRFYDDEHRLIQETLGNGLTIAYAYDRAGRMTSTELPDGSSIGYTYDAVNLKEVQRLSPKGEILYSHLYQRYDQSGNLLSSHLAGQAGVVRYQYDLAMRLTGIVHALWQQKVPTGGYSVVGDLLQSCQKDAAGEVNCEFQYNDLSQLASETGVASHSYKSDSVYNRVMKDQTAYEVNLLNQLIAEGDSVYSYDANGNLIKEKKEGESSKEYRYDALDRLVSMTQDNQCVSYAYDSENRRLSKTVSTRETATSPWQPISKQKFFYSGDNEIGAVNEKGEITELRLLGIGRGAEIGAAVALELQGKVAIPIHDLRGNVACLIDLKEGHLLESYRYSAFGEEQLFDRQGQPMTASESGNPWRFASKRVDPESGFVYFGHRYYHPRLGRWVSPDPLGFKSGPNLYAYVLNNPLTHRDLRGLFDTCFDSFFEDEMTFDNYPAPNIQDVGFCNTSSGCHYSSDFFTPQISCLYDLGRPNLPRGGIGFENGINNSFAESVESAKYLSDLAGGYNIKGVYNGTQGFPGDVLRCVGELGIGCLSQSAQLTRNLWSEFARTHPDPNDKFLQVCHSEGAIVVRNALMSSPKEIRDRIIVLAIAPGGFITDDICCKAYHICSRHDFVPCFDSTGYALAYDTMTILEPHPTASKHDHGLNSQTYTKTIREQLKTFIDEYGGL